MSILRQHQTSELARLRSRVATLEYDVARLRERLDNHDHDYEEFHVHKWEDDR